MSLGTGFVQTFHQFLAVRTLFGIGMGGTWGLASATALENIPVEVRGLASGVFQQGYAVGYLIVSVTNLYLVPHTTWRALFWTGSGISAFAAAVRVILPESEVFLRTRQEKQEELSGSTQSRTRIFLHEVRQMIKNHWRLCVYTILLMSGVNFLAHGAQDLYPTYLQKNKGFSNHDATVATIIGSCGAIVGSNIAGSLSQYIGRRLTIIICVLFIGVFIPLWVIPDTFGKLSAGAFCVEAGVHGSFGVIPIFLSEISPPAFRSTFGGVAYQLGTMVSSASAQIEATGGDHLHTTIQGKNGPKVVPNYALIQGIFIGCVAAFVIVLALIGPEKHGSHFERGKTAFQAGASKEDLSSVPGDEGGQDAEMWSLGSRRKEMGDAS